MTNDELKTFASINADDLEGECLTLSDRLVYLYDLYSTADKDYNVCNEAVATATSLKYIEYRDSMISNNIKPTENLITNYVQADESLVPLVEQKYTLKRQKEFLYGLIQSMNAKRDSIKSLTFLRRNDERF